MPTYFSILLCCLSLNELDFVLTSSINSIPTNKYVEKCANRRIVSNGVESLSMCSKSPEEESVTFRFIKNSGYEAEEHFVTTEDGYILSLKRIPGKPGSTAVLLHHGLGDSSFTWVIMGKKRSLAFKLSDEGYDVWLADARGNSRNHTNLRPSNPEYWNFSYHEIGVYDLPAEIDYIRSIKNDGKKIMYIGHSMGTTVFFVMASQRPDVGSKVAAMFALAPVAYVDHVKGMFRWIEPPIRKLQEELQLDGKQELFPQYMSKIFNKELLKNPLVSELLLDCLFLFAGFNPKGFNESILPELVTNFQYGMSLKTLFHYGWGVRSKKFRQYEYDAKKNLKIYHSITPPDYKLKNIQVPVALFYAENDLIAHPADVKRLYKELPNKIELYKIRDRDFNHVDFTWGNDAPKLLHPRLFNLMEKFKNFK